MDTFIAVIFGGAFLTFLQFIINRYDKKKDELGEIKKAIADLREYIKNIDEKSDRREAVSCRVRILRFEDELQENRHHSKDSFDQVLSDVTTYDNFCDRHPGFRNHQTTATVAHIKSVYNERLEKRDFA